jgi:uncharacterized protein (DUF1499 family)
MLRASNEEVPVHTSRLARLAIVVAVLSAVLFVGGMLLVQIGAVTPRIGFQLHGIGNLIGPIAVLLGIGALLTTRPATGKAGRGLALAALAIGASITVLFAIGASSAGGHPINDITTSLDDPPGFVALTEEPANQGRDMAYPGAEFADQQKNLYPDLAPIEVTTSVPETVGRVKAAMEGFGWEVVRADPASGTVEAMETSRIFRFVDDVVVRVRPTDHGSVVDVRSKSRDGKSDLGANAARIRRLRDALR